MDTAVIEKSRVKSPAMFLRPVAEVKKKSLKEAVAECNAVSVDAFFDELNARIDKWTDHA